MQKFENTNVLEGNNLQNNELANVQNDDCSSTVKNYSSVSPTQNTLSGSPKFNSQTCPRQNSGNASPVPKNTGSVSPESEDCEGKTPSRSPVLNDAAGDAEKKSPDCNALSGAAPSRSPVLDSTSRLAEQNIDEATSAYDEQVIHYEIIIVILCLCVACA